jgi:hypothetical protein
MSRNSWGRYFENTALALFVLGSNVYAKTVNVENQMMQFSYTTNGASDGSINKYGNNEISVSGDVLRVQIGDSDGDRNISGVGIYEMKLKGENLESAQQMAELLCSPKDPKSDVTLPDLYVVRCGGEIRSSYVRDFSRPVAIKIGDLVEKLTNMGVQEGRKIVKLDISLASVERVGDGFVISVIFINGGDYQIKFKTPDKWNTGVGKNMDILAVTDSKDGMSSKIGFALAGQNITNPEQFPDGEVNLAPHSAAVLKIRTNDIKKFSAGTYDLYAGAFMSMEVIGIRSSLLYVDFHSDYSNPTRITFDRDYPSTPKEREEWETRHRADMSSWPVKQGEAFPEDGLYRAVRLGTGTRSLQVQPFKAGAIATTDSVRLLTDAATGSYLDGAVQWLWEASPPVPSSKPFAMVEGTEQIREPGTVCSRSGRWLVRFATRDLKHDYDLSQIVTVQQGKAMPAIRGNLKYAKWEWIGV